MELRCSERPDSHASIFSLRNQSVLFRLEPPSNGHCGSRRRKSAVNDLKFNSDVTFNMHAYHFVHLTVVKVNRASENDTSRSIFNSSLNLLIIIRTASTFEYDDYHQQSGRFVIRRYLSDGTVRLHTEQKGTAHNFLRIEKGPR